jgi:hypothetical protein
MPRRAVAARLPAGSLVLVLAVSVGACSSGQPASVSSSPSATGSTTPSTSLTDTPSPTATPSGATPTPVVVDKPTPAGATGVCKDNQLGAVETRHGTQGTQAFSVVKVVNGSRKACTLAGYPRPAFWASTGYKLVKIPVSVTHGSTAAARDPGAARFLVPPGGTSWFTVATGTGYGGKYRALTYFTFYPTRVTSGVGVLCGVNLATDGPNPVRVTVTAFAPGPGPAA